MSVLVSIILVNYNTSSLIENCLNSIYEFTKDVTYEIIVVDNDSSDNSVAMIREKFPSVILIESKVNLGFGKANNLGIARSNAEYIFLLNSDTLLISNAVFILVDYLQNNPKVGICGGNLYDANYQPAISYLPNLPDLLEDIDYYFLAWKIRKTKYKNNFNFNYTLNPILINGYISGANMMVCKKVLDEVGPFDPDFFLYYEETELTYRIKSKGYLVAAVPQSKIIHLQGSSEQIKENTLREMLKSKFLYYSKTNKNNQIIISFLICQLAANLKFLVFKLLNNKKNYAYWKTFKTIHKASYSSFRERKLG
jgi:hypothetical protein